MAQYNWCEGIETECSEKKKKKTVHDYREHEILASVETRSMGGRNGWEARPPGLVPESIPNLYQQARWYCSRAGPREHYTSMQDGSYCSRVGPREHP